MTVFAINLINTRLPRMSRCRFSVHVMWCYF